LLIGEGRSGSIAELGSSEEEPEKKKSSQAKVKDKSVLISMLTHGVILLGSRHLNALGLWRGDQSDHNDSIGEGSGSSRTGTETRLHIHNKSQRIHHVLQVSTTD
jgi:hypothetical protein